MKWAFSNRKTSLGKKGFTIVELLVVIAVIGILAALTYIAYSGIQAKARDTIVKNAAKQLGVELQRFAADTGKTPLQTGGGYAGGGQGWVSDLATNASYPVATETVLINAGYLSAGFTKNLPVNKQYNSSAETLMLYGCGAKYVIYYSLEAPTSDDTTNFNSAVTQCGQSTIATYGMKGAYIFS
jgi:prepilin-type N-terminal cleavage/methylation domain-containing protein